MRDGETLHQRGLVSRVVVLPKSIDDVFVSCGQCARHLFLTLRWYAKGQNCDTRTDPSGYGKRAKNNIT